MSNGTHHDRVAVTASLAAGGFLATASPTLGISVGLGGVFGALYLSPDLDCKGSHRCKAYHRWRRLGVGSYWRAYAQTIPHHRHWLSHSIVVGTVYRLAWLLFPVAAVGAIVGGIGIIWAIPIPSLLGFYLGNELATAVHLWCDGMA
jgi:uncharacterized metal-binding protein